MRILSLQKTRLVIDSASIRRRSMLSSVVEHAFVYIEELAQLLAMQSKGVINNLPKFDLKVDQICMTCQL